MNASNEPTHTNYLITLTSASVQSELAERLLTAAAGFFELTGGAERRDIGHFERNTRGSTTEILALVSFTVEERRTGGNPLALAKRLEGILRNLIEAVGSDGTVARVFVARGELLQ